MMHLFQDRCWNKKIVCISKFICICVIRKSSNNADPVALSNSVSSNVCGACIWKLMFDKYQFCNVPETFKVNRSTLYLSKPCFWNLGIWHLYYSMEWKSGYKAGISNRSEIMCNMKRASSRDCHGESSSHDIKVYIHHITTMMYLSNHVIPLLSVHQQAITKVYVQGGVRVESESRINSAAAHFCCTCNQLSTYNLVFFLSSRSPTWTCTLQHSFLTVNRSSWRKPISALNK